MAKNRVSGLLEPPSAEGEAEVQISDGDTPSSGVSSDLVKRIQQADDAARLDLLIVETAKEADAIEEARGRSNSPQAASRRVLALKSMGSLIAQKHDLLKAEGLDPNSPAVRELVRLILEKVKAVLHDMELSEEVIQLFFTKLPQVMEGWEMELDRRVKRSLFTSSLAEDSEHAGSVGS